MINYIKNHLGQNRDPYHGTLYLQTFQKKPEKMSQPTQKIPDYPYKTYKRWTDNF